MVTFLILWGVLFYGMRFLEKAENNSKHAKQEYREYLVNELEKDKLEQEKINELKSDENIQEVYEIENNLKIINHEKNEESKRDIIALMLKNTDETTEYFTISKKHAKSSYWFSVISCVSGILMLGLAIYGAIAMNNLQITIIGTVGGVITEVISGTVLWIHNKSALQLNHYYGALHENEKFLSAINIADKLSDEKKEEVYIEIIRKQIETRDSVIVR